MTIPALAKQLLTDFNASHSWEQRMRLLMQAGTTLASLTPEERIEANQVQGCESQVWLVAIQKEEHWHFKAHSDARIIRGLLAVLLARVNNLTASEIAEISLTQWFNQLGLSKQLSSSRRDGLIAIWQRIQTICHS